MILNQCLRHYDTLATGITYFHRFYMFHSFKQFPRYVSVVLDAFWQIISSIAFSFHPTMLCLIVYSVYRQSTASCIEVTGIIYHLFVLIS